ncbi:hypothetical protein ACOMHN_062329 [Nucella lapillus]
MPQAILRSSCSFDTKYFPFDVQTCNLKFGSWTYNGNKLNIDFVLQTSFDLSNFVVSNEWDVLENYAKRNVKVYTCCPDEPYPDVTFTLTLRRKVAFYTFILVLPCALLSLLTLVIFWVPPESPAKLQLGMSVFVAFFFLLLVLADFTPRAAASIPLIGAYFCLSMVMITLSTVLACVVANMYFRGVRINEAPLWLRVVMIDWLSRMMCVQNRPRRNSWNGKEAAACKNSNNIMTWSSVNGCNDKNGKRNNSDCDARMAKVRLLDNGVDSSPGVGMLARHESFDSCTNFDTFQEKAPVSGAGGFSDRVTGPGVFSEKSSGSGGGFSEKSPGCAGFSDKSAGSRGCPYQASLLDEVKGIKEVLQRHENKRLSIEERDRRIREWRVIACVTDRLFFIMYVIIHFVGLMVIFLGT